MGGFFRVTGAPSPLPATCSGPIPAPGSLEGVRGIPILPRPARMSRERGAPAAPFQLLRFARISSQPLVTRVTLERKKELINGFKVVCLQRTSWRRRIPSDGGTFWAPSAHEQTIESQTAEMPPRQTKYGHMQPPGERLASLVSPRRSAPGPPSGRITDRRRAPGSRPRYPARREGEAPRARPSSVWAPHSRAFRRPQPGFGPQVPD